MATDPLEDCIIAIRGDLSLYITKNQDREVQKAGCCLFSFPLCVYDSELALKKLTLADNMVYTLDQIRADYIQARARFANYDPRDGAKLTYLEFTKGFARVKSCIDSGTRTESSMNDSYNGGARLAEALERSRQQFEREWLLGKTNLWSNRDLSGPGGMFDHHDKEAMFKEFDNEIKKNQHHFTAIMTRPGNDGKTQILVPPAFDAVPAYAPADVSQVKITYKPV